MSEKKFTLLIAACVLSVGIFGAGFSIAKAIYVAKSATRNITVKGLAERDVKADLGIWELDYREMGSNLAELNQRRQQDEKQVTAFLLARNFTPSELEVQPVKVEDKLANAYQANDMQALANQRYVVTSGIRVRSTKVQAIAAANQATSILLQQGVPVILDVVNVSPNPSYYFTQLDAIRPAMLTDATRSARTLAAQFAKDSQVHLGEIQTASQGVFQIMSRDTSTMSADWNSVQNALGSIDKKVRLVTTINYRLR